MRRFIRSALRKHKHATASAIRLRAIAAQTYEDTGGALPALLEAASRGNDGAAAARDTAHVGLDRRMQTHMPALHAPSRSARSSACSESGINGTKCAS